MARYGGAGPPPGLTKIVSSLRVWGGDLMSISHDIWSEQGRNKPVYRWTCPICGKDGVTLHEDRARLNLQAHLQGRDDEKHGPRHEMPPEYEQDVIGSESG